MREIRGSVPELAFVGFTRGLLGAGVGMLVAGRLHRRARTIVGVVLAAVGVLTTIPIAVNVRRQRALGNNGIAPSMEPPLARAD